MVRLQDYDNFVPEDSKNAICFHNVLEAKKEIEKSISRSQFMNLGVWVETCMHLRGIVYRNRPLFLRVPLCACRTRRKKPFELRCQKTYYGRKKSQIALNREFITSKTCALSPITLTKEKRVRYRKLHIISFENGQGQMQPFNVARHVHRNEMQ